jgi:hypothetical protein
MTKYHEIVERGLANPIQLEFLPLAHLGQLRCGCQIKRELGGQNGFERFTVIRACQPHYGYREQRRSLDRWEPVDDLGPESARGL